MVERGSQNTRNHQLPHLEAGTGRFVLSADFWSGDGLRVCLRQVQAHQVSRGGVRPLRRGGYRFARAPRVDGAHRIGGSRGARLVFKERSELFQSAFGYDRSRFGACHLLRELSCSGSRRYAFGEKATFNRERVSIGASRVRRRCVHGENGRGGDP